MTTINRRADRGLIPPLRKVREAQGLTLRETARLAEIDAGHLSRIERGEVSLSVDSLARLAKVLGLRELTRLLAQYARAERS